MDPKGDTAGGWGGLAGGLRILGAEMAALASVVGALPWRSLAEDTLGEPDSHPVPVVLVHGIFGDATNFASLRRGLARQGIRRFSSFGYRPRLDYQRLALELHQHVRAVCRQTGTTQVDIVAHSLGGLAARYFMQTGGAAMVRRLVTLGTPYLAYTNPSQELSIFAGDDPIVPPPVDAARRRMHVVEACGHLGLLTDERVLGAVVRYLGRFAVVPGRIADRAA